MSARERGMHRVHPVSARERGMHPVHPVSASGRGRHPVDAMGARERGMHRVHPVSARERGMHPVDAMGARERGMHKWEGLRRGCAACASPSKTAHGECTQCSGSGRKGGSECGDGCGVSQDVPGRV